MNMRNTGIRGYRLLAAAVIIALVALFFAPSLASAGEPPEEQKTWKWEPYGPRVDRILYSIYLSYDARLLAFKKGEVHTCYIQPQRVEEVKNIPEVYILTYQTFNLQFLGINCQKYPWNYTAIRKAVAHLIDREWIIREVFKGFGVPVYSAIPPCFGRWHNPNVPKLVYSKELAKKVLLEAGFRYDPEKNIWYDPHGNPLPEFHIQVPPAEQAPWLFQEAQHIAQDAQSIGLPLKVEPIEFQALVAQIYSRTFEAFILYLGWDRVPTLAYELFRTNGSWNFWGISDPELDKLLEEFYFTADIEKAREALWKAQERLAELLPYIPIYMGIANVGFRTNIAGVVLNKPVGGQHYFTILDVHFVGQPFGGEYRVPLGSDPRILNPFVALTGTEWEILDNIFETLFIANPDDVTQDYPWLAEKWTIEEVTLNGERCTKITFYLRKGVKWQDGEPFTAYDVNFTFWFIKTHKPRQGYSKAFENMIKTEVPDEHTIVVYIKGVSWTYLYDLNFVIVPKHIWGNETLLNQYGGWEKFDPWRVPHPKVKGLTCLIGTGPFIFKERKSGEYILLVWNPLYWARHPEKTLRVELSAPAKLYSGEPLAVKITVKDYLGRPVTNATVKVELVGPDGKIVKTATAAHKGEGVYETTLDTAGVSGLCKVRASVEAGLAGVVLSRSSETEVNIKSAYMKVLPYAVIAIIVIIIVLLFVKARRAKAAASA